MSCTCTPVTTNLQSIITLNQVAIPERRTWRGEEWLVVPVVMAKVNVIMNGATIPDDEFFAPSWNGVPVTFGHPEDAAGEFLSANSPDTLDAWAVGHIFSAEYTDGKLKADAWASMERAEALRPGSVEALETGELQIDVSTGYFATHQQGDGVVLHTGIKPDHLAFLFDVSGACSFEDGCGVRANQHKGFTMTQKVRNAVEALNKALGRKDPLALDVHGKPNWMEALTLETNRRGSPDDFWQMVADLVASDLTPFVPEDMYGLVDLSMDTLKTLRDAYIQTAEGEGPEGNNDAPKPGANQKEGAIMPTEKTPATVPAVAEKAAVLSDEDKQALAFARNQYTEHRKTLVAKISANSTMTDEQLKEMDVPTLQTVADGLHPVANYGVRGGNQPLVTGEGEAAAESTKSMQVPDIFARKATKEGA